VTLNALGVESSQSVRMKYMQKGTEEKTSEDNKQIYQLDFCTYFGSYYPLNGANCEENKLNDVVLPSEESFGSRHFQIKFSIEQNSYFLKDLGEGTGTFIKVGKRFVLKNGHIVSFGENHMVIGIIVDKFLS
jgi:hypothetical protein